MELPLDTSFITTKFFAPRPVTRQVARPRLLTRLSAWQQTRLTLVSAPPGFGKTTAVSEWLGTLAAQVGWVSLDREDDDPARFWTLVVRSLAEVLGEHAQTVERILQSPAPSFRALVVELINRLSDRTGPVVLVLDDYHLVTSPQVHEALSLLIERQPGQLHLVLITRQDPPFPLARLRARGLLNELRAADLRFEARETSSYLNELMSLGLSEGEVAALSRSTEGWVTGLQLAALSLQRSQDKSAFVAAFAGSNRYILDYLIEEILRLQPEPVQRFLLETSVLERLSAPLCDHLLQATDSQAVLDHLEQANLFLIPLDEERRWYRYHHLFADMLRHQLATQRPDAPAALHLRASRWFESEGLVSPAMHHAIAGQHFERAADLFALTEPMLRRGEVSTVLGWLAALPRELLDRRADLLILNGWAVFPMGQHELLARLTERAIHAGERHPETAPALEGQLLALRAFTARTKGDMAGTMALSEQALAALPERDWMWRSRVAVTLATGYQQGDRTELALETFERALEASRGDDDAFHLTLGLALKGMYLLELGRMVAARNAFEEALAVADRLGGGSSAVASFAWVGLGLLHELQGRPAEALEHATKALACAEGSIEPTVNACRLLGTLHGQQGDPVAAERAWQEGIAIAQERRLVFFERYLKAHRAVQLRDPGPSLEQWVEQCQAMRGVRPPHSPLEDRTLLLASAHFVQGDPAMGLATLEEAEAIALAAGRVPLAVRAMVRRTSHLEDADAAQDLLCLALELAAPMGLAQPFAEAATSLTSLARKLESRLSPMARDFARQVFGTAAPRSDDTGLLEPLSDREHEVIRVIAEGLTNQEIAGRLFIEVSTVKRHVTNLFGKLGVTNRTQAVARARSLGLL